MVESGKEIFKKANLGKLTNRQIIKYGKIGNNIGYELTKHNGSEIYGLAFVEKTNKGEYIYNSDNCVEGTLQEMLEYILFCKKEKKLIKFSK